jgi:D-alanine transaminase
MRMYLNGRLVPAESAMVPINDRGLLFGDGIYEVTRAAGGEFIELQRHLRRLKRNLHALSIQVPEDRVTHLIEASRALLQENAPDGDALVYWEVTRGAAPRVHHFPPPGTAPTIFATVNPVVLPHAARARGAVAITTPDIRWARCDIKTVNLLPNVLAKQQAVEAGADEAIFVRDGVVTEGASSNVFAMLDGELRTHPASPYILGGITRDVVLELAHEIGLSVKLEPFLVGDLWRAEELVFSSTVNDVMPIVKVDGRTIGTGRPGPVAQQLYTAFLERIGAVAASR